MSKYSPKAQTEEVWGNYPIFRVILTICVDGWELVGGVPGTAQSSL